MSSIEGEVYYQSEDIPGLKSLTTKSQDLNKIIWRSSRTKITIIETETFRIISEIDNFWSYEDHSLSDQLAICNNNLTFILGISSIKDTENQVIHQFSEGALSAYRPKDVANNLEHWKSVDMSKDQEFLVVGGKSLNNPELGFLIGLYKIRSPRIELIRIMNVRTTESFCQLTRLSEFEIYLLSFETTFTFFMLDKKHLEFCSIGKIGNFSKNKISDFDMRNNLLYILDENSKEVSIISFGFNPKKHPGMKISRPSTSKISRNLSDLSLSASPVKSNHSIPYNFRAPRSYKIDCKESELRQKPSEKQLP